MHFLEPDLWPGITTGLPVIRGHPGAMRGPNRKLVYTTRLIVTDARSSYRAVQGRAHSILLPFPEQVARD